MSASTETTAAGRWLAEQAIARPHLVAAAGRVIASGGRSNDACLDARQFLEHQLGPAPAAATAGLTPTLTLTDYRHAARALHGAGRPAAGDILDDIAPTGAELGGAAAAWRSRYAARQPTADERYAASLITRGQVLVRDELCRGIDGAGYSRGHHPRSGKPAIIVTTSAGTREIVTFANRDDAMAWMVGRAPEATGPLRVTAGPATRTAREEEVLAFLLSDPRQAAGAGITVSPASMTTHLRAEALSAWRKLASGGGTPDLAAVATWYGRSLLRAPGWAADSIGWPGATRAMAYLHRLAATPVTAAQARAAATALTEADATSVPLAAASTVPVPRVRPGMTQPPPAPGLDPAAQVHPHFF
jgi:hypothetical protein